MGRGQPERGRLAVHAPDEGRLAAVDRLGQRHRGVVGALHHEAKEELANGQALAPPEPERLLADPGWPGANGDHPPFVEPLEGEQGGHDLGGGGHCPGQSGMPLEQHLPGRLIGQDRRPRQHPGRSHRSPRSRRRHGLELPSLAEDRPPARRPTRLPLTSSRQHPPPRRNPRPDRQGPHRPRPTRQGPHRPCTGAARRRTGGGSGGKGRRQHRCRDQQHPRRSPRPCGVHRQPGWTRHPCGVDQHPGRSPRPAVLAIC